MTSSVFKLAAAAAAVLLWVFSFANTTGSHAQEPEGNYGVGIPEVFLPKYLAYREAQLASSTPDVMRIRLGYVKGLSTSFVNMTGEAAVNLQTGTFSVSLTGLTPLTVYTVSLVDGATGLLSVTDTLFGLVTFVAVGPTALLSGALPVGLPFGFTIDRVVVASSGVLGSETLGAGSVNVFQKIFHRRLSLVNDSTGQVLFEELTLPPSRFDLVPDLIAQTEDFAQLGPPPGAPFQRGPVLRLATFSPRLVNTSTMRTGGSVKLDKLISQGAELFFEGTFGGNGRTCGTCHPASNNFTIDVPFIKTLPANDPLFVAEFNPALAQLERPALMRSFGLILENLDGLSSPTTRFVMRGVPHTLGLQVSLEQDTTLVPAPAEMTGWSGDGAPVTGSLRDFAIGAVTQHFTKRIQRVSGTDFQLPKEHQLDAMEAFQLSLGRSRDVDLARVTFKSTTTNLNTGKNLFINGGGDPNFGGTCNFCHTNGGALSASLLNQNRNFNTNVEDRPHPARAQVQTFPKDGGFGRNNNGDGTFGNRTFNTASLIEAADTAPFFHNNVEGTLENAILFYTGPEFNNPRAPAARFRFSAVQIDQIADFLRGLNIIQNIEVARQELAEILANQRDPRGEQDTRLQTAFDETQDGIDVLTQGNLYPIARDNLIAARGFISQAQVTAPSQRRPLIQQAIVKLDAARNAVATIAP
jgi:cytochrome c peroxidase